VKLLQDHDLPAEVLAEVKAARRDGLGIVCTEWTPVMPGESLRYEVQAISKGKRVARMLNPDLLTAAASVRQWAVGRQEE
jgi:hypothetical protein